VIVNNYKNYRTGGLSVGCSLFIATSNSTVCVVVISVVVVAAA
jgi:hypothetical protein